MRLPECRSGLLTWAHCSSAAVPPAAPPAAEPLTIVTSGIAVEDPPHAAKSGLLEGEQQRVQSHCALQPNYSETSHLAS
jgi:hypothetical protein